MSGLWCVGWSRQAGIVCGSPKPERCMLHYKLMVGTGGVPFSRLNGFCRFCRLHM